MKVCDYRGYTCNCTGYKAAKGSLCVCGHYRSQHHEPALVCARCEQRVEDPITIGKKVYCLTCTCSECGCELSKGEESVCNDCMEKANDP